MHENLPSRRTAKMDVKNLVKQKIGWRRDPENLQMFYSPELDRKNYKLRMNDFPEEPLWTLFCDGVEIDIEETPSRWEIRYES